MTAITEKPVGTAPPKLVTQQEPVADHMGEIFDVVDEHNVPISTASRQKCHDEGLFHRSIHALLFRSRAKVGQQQPCTEVLLQQRSEKKKVGAGQWDVSVAEHLSAGENYLEAAVRGISEELGVNISSDSIVAVRQPYLSKQVYKETKVEDNMFTSTFAALYDESAHGRVQIDGAEVKHAEWWPVEKLVREAKLDESQFTRWFLIELRNIDMEQLGKRVTGEM